MPKSNSAKAPEHTPTFAVIPSQPFYMGKKLVKDGHVRIYSDGKWELRAGIVHLGNFYSEDTAKQIVDRLNQHDMLVAQVKSLREACDRSLEYVQCVNAHSELVAALQKAIDRLKFDLDLDYGTAKQGQGALPRPLLLEELQAALKKAGAE